MRLEGLYAITPDWQDTPRLISATAALLEGGCRLVQYRNKTAAADLRREQALALRRLCTEADCLFIVNDDPDLALAVEADGVHLGVDDGDLGAVRRRLGERRILGASCYRSLDRARAAVAAGADYVAFGSFFPSPSKPQAPRAEPAILTAARAELPVPVVAIGGITAVNGAALVAAGAHLLAVISALYDAPDPAAAARAFGPLFADISERTPAP